MKMRAEAGSLETASTPSRGRNMQTTPKEFLQAQTELLAAYGAQTESQFVHLPEVNLLTHYLECGQGDPVIMIHGGNSFAASWAPLLRPLAPYFHLFIPDRPGCGLTPMVDYRGVSFREHSAAFVTAFCDSIGIERSSVVGNSMGGYFAFAFALAQPQRVAKLAIVGAAPLINDVIPIQYRLLSIPEVNRWVWSRISLRGALYAHPEKLRPEVLRCARIGASLPGAVENWLTTVEEVGAITGYRRRHSLKDEIKGIQTPTLFLQGDKDAFGTVESVRQVQKAMSNANIQVIPDAGHVPWYDAIDPCAASLLGFLRN
jgi:pimeloyl-ACP methyl ester carboxylesterase